MLALLAAAALGQTEAIADGGRQASPLACPSAPAPSPGEMALTGLRLWPKERHGTQPVVYGWRACLRAPAGPARTRVDVKVSTFRASTGNFWGQGGQSPCRPQAPATPACLAPDFVAEGIIYWDSLFGDWDGLGPAGAPVFVDVSWRIGDRRFRNIYAGEACLAPPEQPCPSSRLLLVQSESFSAAD